MIKQSELKYFIFLKIKKYPNESKKKLGIWMDHSIAHLMEFTTQYFEIKTIELSFSDALKKKI